MNQPNTLLGLDFSSAPNRRKPLVLAQGHREGLTVQLTKVQTFHDLSDWAKAISPAGMAHMGWHRTVVMACDLPFGLPRPFVDALKAHGPDEIRQTLNAATPLAETDALIHALHAHCSTRAGFQALIDAWGQTWHTDRPAGSKLIHRPTDQALVGFSSTSPLQTRYVPVGKMYFEGLKRLVDANFTLPGQRQGRPDAIALEAYPGFLSGEILGRRSYKSESKPTLDHVQARRDLIGALEAGQTRLSLRLSLSAQQRDILIQDAKGDHLDAVLCLIQAAWADAQHAKGSVNWGLPTSFDPVEGWILTS